MHDAVDHAVRVAAAAEPPGPVALGALGADDVGRPVVAPVHDLADDARLLMAECIC